MGRSPEEPGRAAEATGGSSDDSFYRLAFENAPDAVVVAQDGQLKLVNRAAEQLAGRTREELLAIHFLDLVHPADAPALLELYERRLEGDASERHHTFRLLDATGETHWVEIYSLPSRWQGRPAVLAYLAEVTERERQRQQAADLSRLLSRVAELSPYFIFIYDYELGRDVYLNRPVPLALGYSRQEALELQPYPFAKLCHPDDYESALERDARWRDAPDGTVDAVEFRLLSRSGEWRWFRSLNTPFLRDDAGRVQQILGVSLDITEQKRSEEARQRGERLESIGLLAGGLAHDFGNLLTPVLGHADLLLRRLAQDSPLRSQVETIRTAAERAGELVRQLLLVSGRGELALEPVALDALIVEVAGMLEPVLPEQVQLRTEISSPLPAVEGDASQLRQVLFNLVSNARDALAAAGGTIVVRALPIELDESARSAFAIHDRFESGPAVLLEIEDDGPGIDPATQARLWEPFFTTKIEGRGFGLASVAGIVRRHHGGISVDSSPGSGTCFRIVLPIAGEVVRNDGS